MNFATALAYHFFMALPAAFTQPGEHLFSQALNNASLLRSPYRSALDSVMHGSLFNVARNNCTSNFRARLKHMTTTRRREGDSGDAFGTRLRPEMMCGHCLKVVAHCCLFAAATNLNHSCYFCQRGSINGSAFTANFTIIVFCRAMP